MATDAYQEEEIHRDGELRQQIINIQ